MKVSVIIPTYNSEKVICRAIDSILKQEGLGDLFSIEILICDDESPDNTLQVVSQINCDYPIRIIPNKNHTGGPNAGRNNGLRNATGDLIAFLDHDDEWLPNKLKDQITEINNGYEFIYSLCIKKLG